MDDDGDKGESSQLDRRTSFMRYALKGVIAIIAIGAAVASIPYWGSSDFPVTSLIIYVAGMVFVTMPLCLYYESLLEAHEERVAHARHAQGAGFQNPVSELA